jgi:hypothetical protein
MEQKPEHTAPEINIPVSKEALRLPSGLVVMRTTYNTGNVSDVVVWPGDHPNARAVKA